MKDKFLENALKKVIDLKNVLFVTAQFTDKSYDIDIYCVVKNNEQSQVSIYKDHYWIEIFVDTWSNMIQKIKNYDEIAVGFITKMDLVESLSNIKYYHRAKKIIKKKYTLPEKRKRLLQYRIKVLSSKYFSAKSKVDKNFFAGQLLPHLIMAIFNKYGIWPQSPKKWINQIRILKKPESRQIIKIMNGTAKADSLINKLTSDFKGIYQIKDKKNNKITYLG